MGRKPSTDTRLLSLVPKRNDPTLRRGYDGLVYDEQYGIDACSRLTYGQHVIRSLGHVRSEVMRNSVPSGPLSSTAETRWARDGHFSSRHLRGEPLAITEGLFSYFLEEPKGGLVLFKSVLPRVTRGRFVNLYIQLYKPRVLLMKTYVFVSTTSWHHAC